MSANGQGAKCRRNIAEKFNGLSWAHECCRQAPTDDRHTDGRAIGIAYSEREREFTFARNQSRFQAYWNTF